MLSSAINSADFLLQVPSAGPPLHSGGPQKLNRFRAGRSLPQMSVPAAFSVAGLHVGRTILSPRIRAYSGSIVYLPFGESYNNQSRERKKKEANDGDLIPRSPSPRTPAEEHLTEHPNTSSRAVVALKKANVKERRETTPRL